MADEDKKTGAKRGGTRTKPDHADMLVVAIGSSISRRDSLEHFFAHLVPAENSAFIVCLQLQEAIDDVEVLASLRTASGVEPMLAEHNATIEPGYVYLVPSAKLATIRGEKFHLRPSSEPLGERGRIDSLIVSLADDLNERAVGVVLAGTGGDGTLGVAALKEQGGLSIAEETEDAQHVLTTAAFSSASAIVDYVLPPTRMPACIADYARHLAHLEATQSQEQLRNEVASQLGRIATILRNKTGHDFHGYKQNTFMRRVQRRMQVMQAASVERYIDQLRGEHDEVQNLFNDLLIGVTHFFRDKAEFELLERAVIPKLFEGKNAGDHLRVWLLGCATGEEAYSIAILLREHMAKLDTVPHVQIFATDIDGRALATARVGRYAEAVARDVSPERLARWFIRESDAYSVVKELREMCIFSQHNLIKDAPFSRLDLIACRNLLIYLNADLQNRVIPLFHFALRPGGFLFLGNSENVTRHAKLFAPIDRRYRIFKRQESVTRVLPDSPLIAIADRRGTEVAPQARHRSIEANLARRAERIAERYAPAYVVVDENHDVLHFSGRTGRYLDPSTGAASLNLLNLVHRDLRLDLRAALHRAESDNRVAKAERLKIGFNGEALIVNISVEPVQGSLDEPRSYVVVFQDGETLNEEAGQQSEAGSLHLRDEHVQRLENELRLNRERLQATIEELESTNEELKSSNEEYQSINEELQSANEELETSKEELQSVNEELQTVSGELAHRVGELARTNSDLKNLLEGTQIATVFLDNDLRVKNFTPAVTDLFHLIDTDIGRPIIHIAGRIAYPDMQDDVRKVLRTLGTIEREVEDPGTGARYLVRVLPYRSIDNFIAGVVLTFLDITATAKAERALRESEERFRVMAQTVPAILFTAKPDLEWDYVNSRFYEFTGLSDGAALGLGWLATLHPDDIEENQRRWRRSAETGESFEMTCRIRGADGSYRWFLGRAEPIRRADGQIAKWFGSCTDIHESRLAEDRQRLLMSELQHRVKNVLAVVRSLFSRTVETSDTVDEVASHFQGRLDALARTQNVLTRTADGVDLEELVREELLSHGARDGEQVNVGGPLVRLRQKAAEALGLAVHELATNAAKYGALAQPNGRIGVTWRVYGGGGGQRLALEWREIGVRLIDPEPHRIGFGRDLIERGLPYQLGATTALEFNRGGLRCAIELPLSERVAVLDFPERDNSETPQ